MQELAAQKLVSVEASDQIRYDLESARASYELARLELSYTNITAPISGLVAQRMVKPGNLIALNALACGATAGETLGACEAAEGRGFPDWVEVDAKGLKGKFKALPARSELPPTINDAIAVVAPATTGSTGTTAPAR